MSERSRKGAAAPIVTCDARLAAFLGAARVSAESDARLFGEAAMPMIAEDGSRWIWPLEAGLIEAIERQR